MAEAPSAKTCPRCGFKSSAAKKYCDRCGTELAVAASEPDAGAAPDAMIPQTFVGKPQSRPQVPPEVGGFSLPQAGRSQQAFGAAPTKPSSPPPSSTVRPPRRGLSFFERARDFFDDAVGRVSYFVKSVLALLFLTGLGFVGFWIVQQHREARRPEVLLKHLSELYLERLRIGDYATVYAMLTPTAQALTTLEEFRGARDTREWTWANPRVVSVEPDLALVEYDLSIEGRAPQTDYLFFERVGDEWKRPFNWTLLQGAESALRGNAPDIAVLRSQAAVQINPRDPLARAYLCESYYFRRLLAEAERECREALALAAKYPSKVRGRTLRHLNAVLADSLRALGKNAESVSLYSQVLEAPDLPARERCDALRARASARVQLGAAAQANQDLAEAARLCPEPQTR